MNKDIKLFIIFAIVMTVGFACSAFIIDSWMKQDCVDAGNYADCI